MPQLRLSPLRIAIAIGLVLSVLRIDGCRSLALIDIRAQDFRLLQRGERPATPEVVIVAVDDRSIEQVGRWPWPRTTQARLLAQLTAAQPAVVGFDIVQSERQSAAEDDALVEAVRASDRTVLGYFFDFDRAVGSGTAPKLSTFNNARVHPIGAVHVRRAPMVTSNLPELSAAALEVGYFNFFQDPDGSFRRVPLTVRFGDEFTIPLALAMLRVYRPAAALSLIVQPFGVEDIRFGTTSIPVAEDGQMLINYRGHGKTFATVAASDVLAGAVPAEQLRGKLILVGVTATGVFDLRVTPVALLGEGPGYGNFPGIEIQATILDNILRSDFLWQPRSLVLVEAPIILVCALLLGFALSHARGLTAAAAALLMLGGYLAASQWVYLSYGVPLSLVYPLLAIGLTYSAISVQHYIVEEGEKRKTRGILEVYLSPSLARLLSDNPELLEFRGAKRELSILFSDIRGFTTISEGLDPEVLVEFLNAYLAEMTDVIRVEHDGVIRYIGDAIMVVFGAPLPQPDHAERACRAALGMMRRLGELEPDWRARGWPAIRIGIGVNSGPMILGSMGSARHLSIEVVGDNANLGARLEGLTKMYGAGIIASEVTVRAAAALLTVRELDLVQVKGRAQPVRIFEVLGPAGEQARWAALIERFNAGLCAYRERRWDDAHAAFAAVLDVRAEDGPAKIYLDRCRAMAAEPPAADWDGVTVMDSK